MDLQTLDNVEACKKKKKKKRLFCVVLLYFSETRGKNYSRVSRDVINYPSPEIHPLTLTLKIRIFVSSFGGSTPENWRVLVQLTPIRRADRSMRCENAARHFNSMHETGNNNGCVIENGICQRRGRVESTLDVYGGQTP